MNEELTIVIEPGESGWWISSILEVPGAISQGKTSEEAREMVLDCLHEIMAFRREEALKEAPSRATVEKIRIASYSTSPANAEGIRPGWPWVSEAPPTG